VAASGLLEQIMAERRRSPREHVLQSDSRQSNAGGLIDLLSGHNYFVRVVNGYFVFAYSLALHTQRPEFIDVVPEDPRIRQLIEKWLQKSPEPSTPIVLSPVEFELEDGTVRKRSTNFGNFVADIVRGSRNRRNASRTQAQIGLLNSGGFRLDRNIDRGEPINRKLLCDIFYHNNKIREFQLSGKKIREILGTSARLGGTDEGDGDFLQISGLRVAIQGATPGAIELLNPGGLWIPLNDNDVYRVATTDYVSKISTAYSRFFQGSDELEVEPEIRLAAHDEFAALALCTDQERDAYFSDLSVSESRWNFT
jgi:2',3'-cyclic-nucleotide 2'-phosphodiesterase (5'-nucleotidase family)